MADAKYLIRVLFPGDAEYTEITHLLRHESVSVSQKLFNDDLKSVVDTFDFSIKYDQEIFAKFYDAEDKILCSILNSSEDPVFTGYISPELSNVKGEVVESLSLTVNDNSYLLDEEIAEDFEYPTEIGGTPFNLLSKANPASSLAHVILGRAGYAVPDIVASSCPDILVTIQHVVGEAESGTFRQLLDTLLMEHGYVLTFTAGGQFTVVAWDKDEIAPDFSLSGNWAVGQKIKVQKGFWPYDGLRLIWNTLSVMEDALLYRDDLPLELIDGVYQYTGKDVGAGDYYPADGDIEDTYQDFRTDWLDTAYLNRETRLENEDISLISSGDHVCDFTADDGFVIDIESYWPKRSQILFQNAGEAAGKIYTFEIHGTALYRDAVKKITVPETAKKPLEYETLSIFTFDQASRLAVALKRLKRHGVWTYSFTVPSDRAEYYTGQILHVQQADPVIDTYVIIRDKKWNDSTTLISYVGVAITAFNTETVKSTTSLKGTAATSLPGNYFETRYKRSASQPETPTGNDPEGWTIAPPEGTETLWMSSVIKSATGEIQTTWTTPIRITGEAGIDGEDAVYAQVATNSQVFRAKPGDPYSPASIILSAAAYNVVATSWQWQYWTGSAWSAITEATAAAYTVYPGDFSDSRTYRCVINGSIVSDATTLSKFLDGLKNLLDLSSWVAGGTMPPAGWSINGLASENSFVSGYDHNGFSTVLWKCLSDGGNNADGGFVVPFTVDPTKTYRLCIYVRRGTTNGTTYLGCHQSNTENLSGTANTNPYFWTGGVPIDRDCLIMGIIHPAGYVGGSLGISGVYDAITGEKLCDGTEFRMKAGTSEQRMRAYLFYCTASGVVQDFWAPRVDEINGKEETIDALVKRMAFQLSVSSAFINTLVGTDAFFDSVSARILKISGELIAASGQFGGINTSSLWMGAQSFAASDSTFADWWEANVAAITATPVLYPVSGYLQSAQHHFILSIEAYLDGSTRKFNFTTYDDESHTGYHTYNGVTSFAWAWILTGVYRDIQVAAPIKFRNCLWFGDGTKLYLISDGVFGVSVPAGDLLTKVSLLGSPHVRGNGVTGFYLHYGDSDDYVFSVEKTGYTYPTVFTSFDALAFKNSLVPDASAQYDLGSSSKKWNYIYGTYLYATSSRKHKKDISAFLGSALKIILDTLIVNYRYKTDKPGTSLKIGLIAEDSPRELLDEAGENINIANICGVLIKAVQELEGRVRQLEEEVVALRAALG